MHITFLEEYVLRSGTARGGLSGRFEPAHPRQLYGQFGARVLSHAHGHGRDRILSQTVVYKPPYPSSPLFV